MTATGDVERARGAPHACPRCGRMWALRGARATAGGWSFWCRFCDWRVARAPTPPTKAEVLAAGGTAGSGESSWSHDVHLYADDVDLVGAVGRHLLNGWGSGGSAVVVATAPHRHQLRERLGGTALDSAFAQGRYVELDADDTLSLFMRDGVPDRRLFHDTVGALARDVAGNRPLYAFGEMVDVLWGRGDRRAAMHLERLWDELREELDLALLCGYADVGLDDAGRSAVVGAHDHVGASAGFSWGC